MSGIYTRYSTKVINGRNRILYKKKGSTCKYVKSKGKYIKYMVYKKQLNKKLKKQTKRGGAGNYIKKDLQYVNKDNYVLDKDESTNDKEVLLEDIITGEEIKQDRAIIVNGRVYDIEGIFKWIIINEKNNDPLNESVDDKTKRSIKKKYVNVFGKEEYKKQMKLKNKAPSPKPVAYDRYGYIVDKMPNPEWFVYPDGSPNMLYNVDRHGNAVLDGTPVQVAKRALNFDRPGNRGFLVDNIDNPRNFVDWDGDILLPYRLSNDGRYLPVDEYDEYAEAIRYDNVPRNIFATRDVYFRSNVAHRMASPPAARNNSASSFGSLSSLSSNSASSSRSKSASPPATRRRSPRVVPRPRSASPPAARRRSSSHRRSA